MKVDKKKKKNWLLVGSWPHNLHIMRALHCQLCYSGSCSHAHIVAHLCMCTRANPGSVSQLHSWPWRIPFCILLYAKRFASLNFGCAKLVTPYSHKKIVGLMAGV